MNLTYILSTRTNGANPFNIFEQLVSQDSSKMCQMIRQMDYSTFLESAYWFAVSMTAKSRSKMRCQVCNSSSNLNVHHRTYATHGSEHLNMHDLVVLCENCHGLFHGHRDVSPSIPAFPVSRRRTATVPVNHGKVKSSSIPHTEADIGLPDGDQFVLTKELIEKCRDSASFTAATQIAFGVHGNMEKGWVSRLIGKTLSREQYRAALEGRFIYRGNRFC